MVAKIATRYTMPDAFLVAAHRGGNSEGIISNNRELGGKDVIWD